MKQILFLLVVLLNLPTQAQKMTARNGHVWFYSHTPVEDITAHNNQVVSILDKNNLTIQFSLLVKSFEFEKKLMQEHFNENYMESDTYPKSGFTGTITKPNNLDFGKDGSYNVEVSGELTIHGITNKVTTPGIIIVSGSSVNAKAKFIVRPEDYNIKIPDIVKEKIAREIEVNVDVNYLPN